ncbi:MAG TPA: zinc-ribbon domain-containing protein [Thermoplasmata archaeon]|nr:zinc-ribbon domain-containing protein [Thermoplasmata archaeon]
MHLASVVVGAIIAVVGAVLGLTSGVIAGFNLLSLAGCGSGSPCLYGVGGTAIGGIVFVAGLGYLVRGLTQPAMPRMPPVVFPASMPMMGYSGPPMAGSTPSSSLTAAPGSSAAPVFCSACGTPNVSEATYCHRCGKPIARPAVVPPSSGASPPSQVP